MAGGEFMILVQRQPEPEAMDLPEEAAAYAAADFSEVNAAFVARLAELTRELVKALALDLGTGPGDIPLRLAGVKPKWTIAAADVSLPMLRLARAALGNASITNVPLVCVDAKGAPLRDGSFDVIFSNSILHHINDTGRLWSEVARLTKPGALILMRDLARPETDEAAAAIVQSYSGAESALLQEEFYRSLLAAYSIDEVRAQLQAAGLGSLEVTMVSDRHMDIFGKRT
jgi:ubiquinone/menaquinone biosynthesis C-methylase UbiE